MVISLIRDQKEEKCKFFFLELFTKPGSRATVTRRQSTYNIDLESLENFHFTLYYAYLYEIPPTQFIFTWRRAILLQS